MIIVAGTVTVPAQHHEPMVEAIAGLVDHTRAEPGCREFEFWADLARAGRFHVYEVWTDEAALAVHVTTPHFRTFRQAGSGLQAQVDLKRYRAEEIIPT